MSGKKKAALPPSAAKILEQYRSAAKSGGSAAQSSEAGPDAASAKPAKPAAPAPGSSAMRRSGTRGK